MALLLVALYFLIHLPALFVGLTKGFGLNEIFGEMQQSLFWLAAPFFAVMLQSVNMVLKTARLLQHAGVILGFLYLVLVGGIFLGFIDFSVIYIKFSESSEFFFRGESFLFYKGFIYLGISLVFYFSQREYGWKLKVCLVGTALVLTLTRGFILSAATAIIFLLIAQRRWGMVLFFSVCIGVAATLVLFFLPSMDAGIMEQRGNSTSQRMDDMNYIVENITASTLIFGEGFGSLINSRSAIENTYLWALWKLGVFGLIFWLLPLIICTYYFLKISRSNEFYMLGCAYYFGVVLIYVQTATNPYLNNPIGLSFVMISIFSLRTLSKCELIDSSRSHA
jgi:hypothetical protein